MKNFYSHEKLPLEIIQEHVYHIETRGYSVFPDFYDEGICYQLREKLIKALDEYKPLGSDRSYKDQFLMHDLMCRDLMFAQILEDPRLQQIFAPILGDYWIMYAFTSSSLPPRKDNYGSRLHVDSPRFIPNYIGTAGFILALDDFTIENGGTKLLPGSQNSSKIPTEDMFEKNCTQVTCKKGTMLIVNSRIWHRAGFNNTDNWRHSLTLSTCRVYMKQRFDWPKMIPENISNQLNDQARRIIGFDSRIPKSLEEFFVDDEKRLYKPNQE